MSRGYLPSLTPESSLNRGDTCTTTGGNELHRCQIHCPCSICSDLREFSNKPCGELGSRAQAAICHQTCNRVQCKEHKILLPRQFNSLTDHFTIVTGRQDELRYATAFPGIPFGCNPCSQDVKEHQIFHLVPHTLCKYCRFEMRPLAIGTVTKLSDYKKATELLEFSEEVTCGNCFKTCVNERIRKKHELTHGDKLICDQCGLAYSNSQGLNQHIKLKHQDLNEKNMESLGLTMSRGCQGKSSKKAVFKCFNCNKRLSSEKYLKRHMKETHPFYESKNIDFIADL